MKRRGLICSVWMLGVVATAMGMNESDDQNSPDVAVEVGEDVLWNENISTALKSADYYRVIELLAEYDRAVNKPDFTAFCDHNKRTLLIQGVSCRRVDIIKAILKRVPSEDKCWYINQRDRFGFNAVDYAVWNRCMRIAQLLLPCADQASRQHGREYLLEDDEAKEKGMIVGNNPLCMSDLSSNDPSDDEKDDDE
jgi:hypothetical protein